MQSTVDGRQARALVLGAGGFIGNALAEKLAADGIWVRGVDLKLPEFGNTPCHEFVTGDLRDPSFVQRVLRFQGYGTNFFSSVPSRLVGTFDVVYQLAADMGGAGFVFTGENDADILHNSALINLNVLEQQRQLNAEKETNHTVMFYSGSACMYPAHNQNDPEDPNCREDSAYPANPDSEYGWEKLFSERLYLAYMRNYGMPVRIARYHNIFGPKGTWEGGREKAPAAICRKIAQLPDAEGTIEIWGDGHQTRSFLFIDECVEATRRLVESDFTGPVNIGSEEMVTINGLVKMVADISGKVVHVRHIDGPLGVRGRNSQNDLFREKMQWAPNLPLHQGLEKTYAWVARQVEDRLVRRAAVAVLKESEATFSALKCAMRD